MDAFLAERRWGDFDNDNKMTKGTKTTTKTMTKTRLTSGEKRDDDNGDGHNGNEGK